MVRDRRGGIGDIAAGASGSRQTRAADPFNVAGLLYIKHAYNLSDEATCERWLENCYWQCITGEVYFKTRLPCDPRSFTRWRNRLREAGLEELLSQTIEASKRLYMKILIVHSQLEKHGSERLLYELSKLLMIRGYSVEVLVRPFRIKQQYYYSQLAHLGITVHRRLVTWRHFTYLCKSMRPRKGPAGRILRMLYGIFAEYCYYRFSRNYQKIIVIGMETYCDTFAMMKGSKTNFYVHHVMYRFQQDRQYDLEYDLPTIIIGDLRQRTELNEILPHVKEKYIPNLIDLSSNEYRRSAVSLPSVLADCDKLRIGVVSRIQKDRPNEPLIRHFAALQSRIPAELHFFGGGDPKIYNDIISELGLDLERVRFHGHAVSIVDEFEQLKIGLAWSVISSDSISYSAIEMIAHGIPVFFINIGGLGTSVLANHTSSSVAETMDFHSRLLERRIDVPSINSLQMQFITEKYDSNANAEKVIKVYGL